MAHVFCLGSNGLSQLGIGHKEDVSVPKSAIFNVPTPSDITTISAGGNHTLVLAAGVLYSAGDFVTGARGISPQEDGLNNIFRPVLLDSEGATLTNSDIAFCAATWESSIIVQKDNHGRANQVFTFGIGNKGELGQGEILFRSAKPQLIKDFPPIGLEIVDLAASVSHAVAVLSNGDVYGWGSGRKGQLGEPQEVVYAPRKITGLDFKVVQAVGGREFTYLVSETKEGKHAVLGSDKWEVRSATPASVTGWKEIGAGWGSIIVLLENGKVLSWGRNDHGQLPSPETPLFSKIVVGSEHALGLTLDGDVLAWGWGEHGNCGPNTTEGDVKDRWNVIASSKYIPPGSKIYSIGAGCATSWVLVAG